MTEFQQQIVQGIPQQLPAKKPYPKNGNPAPKRKDILSKDEKKLAVQNALRYFPEAWHKELAPEFAEELKTFGRIYMHRFKPIMRCMHGPFRNILPKHIRQRPLCS